MTRHLQYEGPELEQLLDHVNQRHGAGAKIIKADKAREGGIAGFFAREVFHVVVAVEDGNDAPRSDAGSVAQSAVAGEGQRSITGADGDEALWSIVAAGATSAASAQSGADFAATLGKLLSEDPPAPVEKKRPSAEHPGPASVPVARAKSVPVSSPTPIASDEPIAPVFPVVKVEPVVKAEPAVQVAAVPPPVPTSVDCDAAVPPPVPDVRKITAAVPPPIPASAIPRPDALTTPQAPETSVEAAASTLATPSALAIPAIPAVSMPALETGALGATQDSSPIFSRLVFSPNGDAAGRNDEHEAPAKQRIKLSGPTQPIPGNSALGSVVELSNRRIQRQVDGSMSFDELLGAFESAQLDVPELPTSGVVAVVGSLVEAEPLASMMSECVGGSASDVLVLSPGDETDLPSPSEVMGLASQLRRRRGNTVVVLELLPGLSGHMWVTQMLAHLSAAQVRYVVGGGRTAEGTTIALQALGRVDVIDLVAVHEVTEPERFLELGTPVGSLDSRTPTPALWAAAAISSRVNKDMKSQKVLKHPKVGDGREVITPTSRRAE